jgi:hypothetical protein
VQLTLSINIIGAVSAVIKPRMLEQVEARTTVSMLYITMVVNGNANRRKRLQFQFETFKKSAYTEDPGFSLYSTVKDQDHPKTPRK